MKIGLQLYTLRGEMEKDFAGALRKVAELGYQGVEFAGYGGYEAAELKKLLDELHLQTSSSHVSFERLNNDLDGELAYIRALDCRRIVIPYLNCEDEQAWAETIRKVGEIAEGCARRDVQLFYHNHDFEFRKKIGDELIFDAIFQGVPARLLQVELDSCWVHYGGCDPVDYINKYRGRLPLLHIKDMKTLSDGKARTVELGAGEVRLQNVAAAAGKAGVEWLIVEQDFCENPPFESIAASMKWLREHKLA